MRNYKFNNPNIDENRRGLADVWHWLRGRFNDPSELLAPPASFDMERTQREIDYQEPFVTWAGHSSFALQVEGLLFMTDPVWSKRCSPIKGIGPKRRHKAPFTLEELGGVNFVLISHNHYDHLDKKCVKKIAKLYPNTCFVVPRGVGRWMQKRGIDHVIELDWWQSHTSSFGSLSVHITAVPAQHFSGRGLFDQNKTLWSGFVVEIHNKARLLRRFYYAGDTGYNARDFKEIGSVFGEMDLSLIPIGAYTPRAFQNPMHVDPKGAITIHNEVGSSLSLGCHWHTFKLSSEDTWLPAYELEKLKNAGALRKGDFRVIYPGDTINW